MKVLIYGALWIGSFIGAAAANLAQQNDSLEKDPDIRPGYHQIFGVETKANKLVMVSQTPCSPCEKMKPILKRLKEDGYRASWLDKNEYKGEVEVSLTPTLIFYRDNEVIDVVVGTMTRKQITQRMEKWVDIWG